MPELKITAVDTSLAMDEVEKQLGPDALILSTTRRDGMIEILATNEPEQIDAANLKAKEKAKARRESRLLSELPSNNTTEKFSELIDAEVSKLAEAEDKLQTVRTFVVPAAPKVV